MALRIVIDVRHLRNFGIGTYIRNLVVALGQIDRENHYLLASQTPNVPELGKLPSNFELAIYQKPGKPVLDHLAYPWFLRGLSADLIHMPVNDMPIFMP